MRNDLPGSSGSLEKRRRSRIGVMRLTLCAGRRRTCPALRLIDTPSGQLHTLIRTLHSNILVLPPVSSVHWEVQKHSLEYRISPCRSIAFALCGGVCVCLGFRCHFIADILFALHSKKANIRCRILIRKHWYSGVVPGGRVCVDVFFLFFHALFDYRAWLRGYIFVTELPLASTHTPTCCSECGRASRR